MIVGGGAAGFAAAEMLRREGFAGSVTLLSSDDAPPYDRPNCSKDYLAGNAPEEWMPLRPAEFYREHAIESALGTDVDRHRREGATGGCSRAGEACRSTSSLLATGAEPVRLDIPGADRPHVHLLRSLGDARAIIANAKEARHAVVIGASFIGLEAAASLRAREWRSMSWRPSGGRWNASSAANSATSSARCTKSTASSSISRRRQLRSTGDKVSSKAERR